MDHFLESPDQCGKLHLQSTKQEEYYDGYCMLLDHTPVEQLAPLAPAVIRLVRQRVDVLRGSIAD